MEEEFILPVEYKSKQMELPCVFRKLGYTYKISIIVNNQEFNFEPDEEGRFRVVFANIHEDRSATDRALLIAITDQLNHYFK